MSKPRFRFLTGDGNWQQYGGKFISQRLSNGEFDYWMVIEVMNWEDVVGEREAKEIGSKYNVALYSVSPQEAGEEQLQSAFRCCGLLDNGDDASTEELRKRSDVQVECLSSYGVQALLWQANGNNIKRLMRDAKQQAMIAESLYGFYMDRAQNAIGSSDWEMQRGDLLAPLDRLREERESV